MSRRWPFLIPFVFMAAGITLSVLNGIYCDITSVAAIFLCLLLACFLPYSGFFSVCTALFFFIWGLSALHPWLSPEASPYSVETKASDIPITIEGVVLDRPSVAPEESRLTVQVEQIFSGKKAETASGTLLLYVGKGDVSLLRGDRIRFVSRLSVPRRLGLPGEFDYTRYLAFQGISATCRVASQGDIVLIRAAAVTSWQRTVDRTAQLLGDAIRRSVPDERISSILAALLIGDQRRIPHDLSDAYTRAGVNLILSISMSVSSQHS
jgi:competence protein ComEC